MNLALALNEEVRERLSRDCAAHEQTITMLLAARREGALDPDLTFRQCALELHSVKGMVSVLGLAPVLAIIGPLCERMLRGSRRFDDPAWELFGPWFSTLLRCLESSALGHDDAAALKLAAQDRDRLLLSLAQGGAELARSEPRSANWTLSPSAGRRLLLVDDSATICAALSAQLRDRGYPVRAARNLAQATELLASFAPEIVVTDVHMPEVEGDELCRRIKAGMTHVVPVVLYSILPEPELRELAHAAGADAYVCKEFGVEALVKRMDELLSSEILF
jgi:CheY-like chemotaxis protein